MKITKIQLHGSYYIDLPIVGALATDTYVCVNVDGLGPPDVAPFLTNTQEQGGIYTGRKVAMRQLIFTIGLNPISLIDQGVEEIRNYVYGLLSVGQDVSNRIQITLYNGATAVAYTTGYASKIEPNHFSKDPQVIVTIACAELYWSDPNYTNLTWPSPYSPVLVNDGNAPAGLELSFTITANAPSWYIQNLASGVYMGFTKAFLNNDIVYVTTTPGIRAVSLLRGGVVSSLLPWMNADADWPMLAPGTNNFSTSGATYPAQTFNWALARYRKQYWGV